MHWISEATILLSTFSYNGINQTDHLTFFNGPLVDCDLMAEDLDYDEKRKHESNHVCEIECCTVIV